MDFTIVTAIDAHHLNELEKVYPDWVEYKKEFRTSPMVIIYDTAQVSLEDPRLNQFRRSGVTFVPWSVPDGFYPSQREKMLTALTVLPSRHVNTEWYLKIDTDTVALNNSNWVPSIADYGRDTAFISNSWGYTKPADAIQRLDNWADKKDYFLNTPRLDLPFDKSSNKIKHSRIISWLFFARTAWSATVSETFRTSDGYRLPFPSQDTCLWYCAKRKGIDYKTFRFKDRGWDHRKI